MSSMFKPIGESQGIDMRPEHMQALGSRLSVPLTQPLTKGTQIRLEIAFSTSPQSSALQWLGPAQTAGKRLPYLFSQCQAIHARSMVPCQVRDLPLARLQALS